MAEEVARRPDIEALVDAEAGLSEAEETSVRGFGSLGPAERRLTALRGRLPNPYRWAIIYLPTTLSLIDFTGVAARRAGLVMGAMVVVLALLPKVVAILHTVPRPVTGSLLMTIMGLLFVGGTRSV